MKTSKSIKTGNPPDIAFAIKEDSAWNVVVRVYSTIITFAAIDKDHAQDLAKSINDCAWVAVK